MRLWHDALAEPTVADALVDRLIHNAHRMELRGDSIRRARDHLGAPSQPDVADYATEPDEGGISGD